MSDLITRLRKRFGADGFTGGINKRKSGVFAEHCIDCLSYHDQGHEEDCVFSMLREAADALEAAHAMIERWRSWAQFVYLGGGPVTLDDMSLQAAVCAKHDADYIPARDTLNGLHALIAEWEAKAEQFRYSDDEWDTGEKYGLRECAAQLKARLTAEAKP